MTIRNAIPGHTTTITIQKRGLNRCISLKVHFVLPVVQIDSLLKLLFIDSAYLVLLYGFLLLNVDILQYTFTLKLEAETHVFIVFVVHIF